MICRNEAILCSCVRWKWSKEVSAARGIEIGVSYTPFGKRLARLERVRLACRRYSSSDMGLRLKDSRDRTWERISEKDIRFLSIDCALAPSLTAGEKTEVHEEDRCQDWT